MSNATFAFGRFNPPTEEGHGKLVSAVQKHAEETGGKHYIFPTKSQDKKKNPMSHEDKVHAMKKLFPTAHIASHKDVHTVIDAVKHLESKGHTHVTMVAGSDRVEGFKKLLNQYKDKEFPKIKKINVVSAGHRDPDAEGAEGMSASKLRGLVAAGKKKEFVSHYSDPKLGAHIHDKVKEGMQMKESASPVGIFLLGGPGSGKDYVLKNIFSRFDLTEVQADQLVNGAAAELYEGKKNIVINGAADESKITLIQSILEGYEFDYVHVGVTNKVSRIRNEQREQPLSETKRIEKFLKAEKLAENYNCFVFNNSINLNESTEMEQVMFGGQIEKLLEHVVNLGLEMNTQSEQKLFMVLKEDEKEKSWQKKHSSVERIANKHGMSIKQIKSQLKKGVAVEGEHSKDADLAADIALNHIGEIPDYYDRLANMEKQGKAAIKEQHPMTGDEIKKKKLSDMRKSERDARVRDTRVITHQNAHIHAAAKGSMSEEVVQEEKDFPAVKHHKSGLPSKYVAGLTPAEIKAKKAAIAKNAKLSDKDPEAYKDMPGDKRIREKGIPQSKYTKKYHDIYGEAANPAQQAAIAIAMKKAGKKPKNEEVEQVEEGAADTSLAAKAAKSGISVGTLRKVYNRGVAAWNSGHRPGTTPAQWGHARVNSYITKGKTYHTADKDLHEEEEQIEDIDALFEMQLVGTDSYREHAISTTPGQKIEKPFEECECGNECDCEKMPAKSFRDLRKEAKDPTVDVTPELSKSAVKKKRLVAPPRGLDSTLQGLPVSSRFTAFEQLEKVQPAPKQQRSWMMNKPFKKAGNGTTGVAARNEEVSLEEAVQYHLDNNISITENVFRPGSDMFFQLIGEAKRLYKEGKYTPADEYEQDLLNSDIGEKVMFEGQEVMLDFPFAEEINEEDDPTGGKGIGKPFRSGSGGAVYVRTGDGGVKKVNFSQSGMKKRYNEPGRVRSFVARHHCLTNKDKTSASYWACRWPRYFSDSGQTWW